MSFHIGDRVRFTYPATHHKRGQFLDATVVAVTPWGEARVRYDQYKPEMVCTPNQKCLTALDETIDETEAFFV